MESLDFKTKQIIEELFELDTGYVLNFSNNSFNRFIKGTIEIDIYNGSGYEKYCSKADMLRQIFEEESNTKVVKLIEALVGYYEDYKMKESKLTDYDKKKIKELKVAIENLKNKDEEKIYPIEELDEIIKKHRHVMQSLMKWQWMKRLKKSAMY